METREYGRPEREKSMRSETLLPLVRAAMSRGEGPPAVLAFVRSHGQTARCGDAWTGTDETHARVLANRLADVLTNSKVRTDSKTRPFGETFAAQYGSRV